MVPIEKQESVIFDVVQQVLGRYQRNPVFMVQILREIQEACDWLSPAVIDCLQRELAVPRTKIEGVAGFYSFFYLQPRGRYRILFSDNITDRMLDNMSLMERLCSSLWIEPGKVSEDGLVSVDRTSCTGMCDQGPALLVNNRAITRLTAERVDQIAELVRNEIPLADWPVAFFKVDDPIRKAGILLASTLKPGEALQAAHARAPSDGLKSSNMRSWREGLPTGLGGPVAMLDEIKRANLRGRGGPALLRP